MLKSSLLEILRTFSKQELIKFEDFVMSPYHNKKENVVKLFLEIKRYAPSFTDTNLEKEKIWVKVFPGIEYNYGIMKNLIHELTKLSESFITIEHSNNKKLENNLNLLETLLDRKITKVFSSKIEMIEKIYDNPDFKSESYSIESYYEFLNKLYYMKSQYNWHDNMGSLAAYELTCRSTDYLILSAIITFYKYFNNYLIIKNENIPGKDNVAEVFLAGLNKTLISPLLENVKVNSERDYLILKCYHAMNIAIDADADINSYFNFKKSLIDCSDIISKDDLRNLLICLVNSLKNLKEDKSVLGINFNKEIMETFDLMIEHKTFLELNGMMEGNKFYYYCTVAFDLKEYESIEILVKKFGNKIPENRRENENNYSQALIYFGKKQYSKSLEHLSRINLHFFNMKFVVKNIQMMNYYELNDYVSFNYVLDTYRHFFTRNKSITSYTKSAAENFCKNMNKLFKLRESFDKFELEEFRKQIKGNELTYKYWMLDKISEIEKDNS